MAESKKDILDKKAKEPVYFAFSKKVETIPLPDIVKHKSGRLDFGKDNLYPDFLMNTYFHDSGKHSAIVNRKVKMIAGGGFEETEDKNLRNFILNPNGKDKKNLSKIAKLAVNDLEVHNYFTLGIRWNIDKTKIAAIDYQPAHKFRLDEDPELVWMSDDWGGDKRLKGNKPRKMQMFNTDSLPEGFDSLSDEDKKFYCNQILYVKVDQTGTDDYVLPGYNAMLHWILSDGAISRFTLNMIKKKFNGDYHIDFRTGIPEPDERKKVKRDFKKEYLGEEAETIIITFSDPEGEPASLNALPSSGNENIYEKTEMRCQENIMIGHEVTNPNLFGIAKPGELAGRNRMNEDLEIFQAVYIDDRQMIVENELEMLAKVNGISAGPKFKKYSLDGNSTEKLNDAQVKARKTVKRLRKLPEFIASKVMEQMSSEEIRSLADLEGSKPEESNQPIIPTQDG